MLKIDSNKVIVNYCGIDRKKFDYLYNIEQCEKIRKKYNLPCKYILFVGQARKNKNLINLVKGYANLKSYLKEEYHLVLANSNLEIEQLVETLNLSDKIHMLNGIDDSDLCCVYKMSSLVALISLSEGFGLPLIESMYCGIPTITSNISCMPEITSGASFLIDPYDIDSISLGITECLTNYELRENLIKSGNERVKEFDWQKTARNFIDVIERLNNE